jgi:hypothetical protein
MAIISVTRFKLRGGALRGQALFFWHTFRSIRQASGAPGFLHGKTYADADRTYWTVTVWEDRAAVRAFQTSGAHLAAMRAMPRLMRWCDEAATGHWESSDGAIPSLPEIHRRFVDHARLLKLRQPSPAHAAGSIAPPRGPDRSFAIRLRRVRAQRASRSAV